MAVFPLDFIPYCCCCCYLYAGIYDYIPEANHVSRVYNFAAVLNLQFVLHVVLFLLWNMFCTFILALSIVCVQCPIQLFFFSCSSLISCFPSMLFWYCLSDFEMVPTVTPITGITFAFIFHMCSVSVMGSLYFKNLLSFCLDHTFVSRNCNIY